MPADNGTFVWMATYRSTTTKAMEFKKGFVILSFIKTLKPSDFFELLRPPSPNAPSKPLVIMLAAVLSTCFAAPLFKILSSVEGSGLAPGFSRTGLIFICRIL